MRFSNIFKELVSITHHDYAGWEEKQGWDHPDLYMDEIRDLESKGLLDSKKFKQMVDDYLVAFQDRHMYFVHADFQETKASTCGFHVRRFDNSLYVTHTSGETRFPIGTKIISIDDSSIEQISTIERNVLREKYPEREYWQSILDKSTSIETVNELNEITSVALNKYDQVPYESKYTIDTSREDSIVVSFSDFEDADKIAKVIKNLISGLESCRNIVIDIRQNGGGNANSLSSLYPLVFPKGEKPSSKVKPREFNCTVRNSNLFIQLCEDTRKLTKEESTLSMLDFAEKQFKKFRGQGFVQFDFTDYLEKMEKDFQGNDTPKNVIILTDSYTASAAEEFVEVCKQSSKVTLIGRATMGINDYSDLVYVTWNDEYTLYYPISRLENKTKVHEIHGKGIQPDVYIPWTPTHLEKDVDLETALELLRVQNS